METGRHKVVVAVLTQVYRLFLYCYPMEFRNSFGTEMVDVFGRRCHAACDQGFAKLLHLSIVGFVDLFATASAEHADIAPGRPDYTAWPLVTESAQEQLLDQLPRTNINVQPAPKRRICTKDGRRRVSLRSSGTRFAEAM